MQIKPNKHIKFLVFVGDEHSIRKFIIIYVYSCIKFHLHKRAYQVAWAYQFYLNFKIEKIYYIQLFSLHLCLLKKIVKLINHIKFIH